MALTGQLSDMSLAELIEFFCNQRKTGRLKIDYPRGHSVFFIKEGELVDAKVGALSGPEAVYFSLTLPNAAFDFSPDVQATRRTIDSAWTQVVLEGLRRLDEGLSPTEADAFGAWSPSEAELAQMFDQVEHLDSPDAPPAREKARAEKARAARAAKADETAREESPVKESKETQEPAAEPFSMMVESASVEGGSKKRFVFMGVAAAVVLAVGAAAVPLLKSPPVKPAAAASAAAAAPAPAVARARRSGPRRVSRRSDPRRRRGRRRGRRQTRGARAPRTRAPRTRAPRRRGREEGRDGRRRGRSQARPRRARRAEVGQSLRHLRR